MLKRWWMARRTTSPSARVSTTSNGPTSFSLHVAKCSERGGATMVDVRAAVSIITDVVAAAEIAIQTAVAAHAEDAVLWI